jgi:hypothetical protein
MISVNLNQATLVIGFLILVDRWIEEEMSERQEEP